MKIFSTYQGISDTIHFRSAENFSGNSKLIGDTRPTGIANNNLLSFLSSKSFFRTAASEIISYFSFF